MPNIEQIIITITREVEACLAAVSAGQLQQAVAAIDEAERVYVAGAGRSGFAMRAFAMRLMHLGRPTHFVGDATTPAINQHDLLVIGSGSGSTGTLQVMAKKAKRLGANILLVTIDTTSPIAALANVVIRIPAPSVKAKNAAGVVQSIQPMGSLFEQCLFLLGDTMICGLMDKHHIGADEMFERHANLE